MGVFSTQRPTLPALHTLNLPNPSVGRPGQGHRVSHECSYDYPSLPRLHIPPQPRSRQVSNSSSMTTISEYSSPDDMPPSSGSNSPPSTPVLSICPLSSHIPSPHSRSPYLPPARFRLEPCSMGEAQAIVLVPPPSAPFIPSPAMPNPSEETEKRQALLLVGPALQPFRHPNRPLAKGARVQPYRIVPSRRKM